MIHATGKVPSPLPKSLNQSTGKYSTQATGFNDASLSENTCSLVKLITHKLWPKSYNKIVEGTRAFAKKMHGVIQSDEVINLTADEPPTEFAIIVDLPTDNEGDNKGGNASDDGNLSNDGNMVMSLHSVQNPFTPFYNALYIYTLWVYNTIWPFLQIRSTLTLSNGLPLSSLLSWYHWWLTHDHVWVSPIATLIDEPWTHGCPLWSLSLSLPSTMCKCCNQFVRPFTLFLW